MLLRLLEREPLHRRFLHFVCLADVLRSHDLRAARQFSDLGIAQELYGHAAVRPPIVHHRLMAPEVLAGGYSTKQSDLYQLGLLMYHMHTGEYPIDVEAGYDAVIAQIRDGIPRLKAEALGTPLGDVISVLLRRTEQYRYTSAAQVWDDLRRLDVWGRTREERRAQAAEARAAEEGDQRA